MGNLCAKLKKGCGVNNVQVTPVAKAVGIHSLKKKNY
jgi:hypothetical protein